ncbi:prepilin peptidase [Corynebacterium breve]|uniref:Prepilin peptidase n=1 Tax=Corynebacterium breve TaxID=3049799 RepID=A0ABY8VL56_9CORY|nr:prepilin peptidase [Corynebacterium breve]WIM68929.1 prepilin peptidase [Corynebacterium breve]
MPCAKRWRRTSVRLPDVWVLGGILWSVALCHFDVTQRRLPNWLTVPAAIVALIFAAIVAPHSFAGLIWPLTYLFVGLVLGGVGGGDIKLAISLGIVVAFHAGILGVCVAMATSSMITALVAWALKQAATAHGPSMLIASWLCAIIVHH